MEEKKILIVEDEKDIAEIIQVALKTMGLNSKIISNGAHALDYIQGPENESDLYILDRMLPESNGVEICRFLRTFKKTKSSPILMVTAMTSPEHIVEGLDAGADDYITKPFDVNILKARVKALLRRMKNLNIGQEIAPKIFQIKGIKIDIEQFKAWCDDELLELTLSEFKLLTAFMEAPGKVFSRNQLVEYIQDGPIAVTDRTIDTHVFGLRKKLGPYSSIVETIRGIGYRVISTES